MRNALIVVGIGAAILLIGWYFIESADDNDSMKSMTETFVLTSSAFEHGGMIPSKYTCDGGDVSPPLSWSGVPNGTKSLALIMDDSDAPGGTWDHWIVFNMSPNIGGIAEGTEPAGTSGTSSFGRGGWGAPCPPSGEHRYVFRLYALDTMLELLGGATKADVLKAMEGHVLAQGELTGRYKRSR